MGLIPLDSTECRSTRKIVACYMPNKEWATTLMKVCATMPNECGTKSYEVKLKGLVCI